MKMSGRRRTIVVFIILGYPWETESSMSPTTRATWTRSWEKARRRPPGGGRPVPWTLLVQLQGAHQVSGPILCGGTHVGSWLISRAPGYVRRGSSSPS